MPSSANKNHRECKQWYLLKKSHIYKYLWLHVQLHTRIYTQPQTLWQVIILLNSMHRFTSHDESLQQGSRRHFVIPLVFQKILDNNFDRLYDVAVCARQRRLPWQRWDVSVWQCTNKSFSFYPLDVNKTLPAPYLLRQLVFSCKLGPLDTSAFTFRFRRQNI